MEKQYSICSSIVPEEHKQFDPSMTRCYCEKLFVKWPRAEHVNNNKQEHWTNNFVCFTLCTLYLVITFQKDVMPHDPLLPGDVAYQKEIIDDN